MVDNRQRAQAQRARNFAKDREQSQENQTAVETVVIAEEKSTDEQNKQAIDPDVTALEKVRRDLKYPLTISSNYPARIIFKAIEVEGVNIGEKIGDSFSSLAKKFTNFFSSEAEAVEGATTSISDGKVEAGTKQRLEELEQAGNDFSQSFDNVSASNLVVGTVTLPLQRDLRFSDNAQYETANLGVLGGALEQGIQGRNAFAGITQNNQLVQTASAIAASAVAKGVGEAAGAAIGATVARGPGAVLGVAALGGAFDGLSPAVRSATRIATAPNQRTLFQQVNIRSFAFTFKMIANNQREAEEIKSIVQFFRQELYPEKIPLGETGVPLGYKFPNMFEIEIKNRLDQNPAFKIQRCYLRDVQTSFNPTATGMHDDGSFVEVDISLAFQEIVALDKAKVRDGKY